MKPLEAIRRENEDIAWKSRLGPKAKELLKLPCVGIDPFSKLVRARFIASFVMDFSEMEREDSVLDIFEFSHIKIFQDIVDAFYIKFQALKEIRNTGKVSEETLRKLKGEL